MTTTTSIPQPQDGISIGYGLVTVADSVLTGAYSDLSSISVSNQQQPLYPPPAPYHSRLAWIVIDTGSPPSSSGAEGISSAGSPGRASEAATTTTTAAPVDYYYQAFIMDAVSGTDPLLYYEDGYAQIPFERWSAQWTLESVSAADHRYSGTIDVQVLSCDGYTDVQNVDRDHPGLQVVVDRPISATCGPVRTVSLTVQAATVFQSLPANIAHDPTGLVVTNPFQGSPATASPEPPIITLDSNSYGTTVTAPVGTVFSITPLTTGFDNDVPAATSSDPYVLSELTAQPAAGGEYRAWEPGTVTLTIPKQACAFDKPPCTGPWYVHLAIHP